MQQSLESGACSLLSYLSLGLTIAFPLSLPLPGVLAVCCLQNANLLRVVETAHDKNAFEEEPSDLEVGISIRNITKIYDKVYIA